MSKRLGKVSPWSNGSKYTLREYALYKYTHIIMSIIMRIPSNKFHCNFSNTTLISPRCFCRLLRAPDSSNPQHKLSVFTKHKRHGPQVWLFSKTISFDSERKGRSRGSVWGWRRQCVALLTTLQRPARLSYSSVGKFATASWVQRASKDFVSICF